MNTLKNDESKYASATQLILAKLYRYVTVIGLLLMTVVFFLYTSAILPAKVPATEVSAYWHLETAGYIAESDSPVGWDFVKDLSSGENLSFGTLAFMALAIIFCLIIMMVVFLRKKNWLFASIALIQALVLLLAASGIVAGH